MSRRTERVAELVRQELSDLLVRETRDPRLRGVTVTRVDVAPDLSHAQVFWSVLEGVGSSSPEEVAEGLAGAASFLRGRLARALSLKRTPELRFRHDPSLALGTHTLALLREIENER